MAASQSLETFTYHASLDSSGTPSWQLLVLMLSSVPSPHLTHLLISLKGPFPYSRGEVDPLWIAFQRACVAHESLKKITFEWSQGTYRHSQLDEKEIRENLPLLDERGLLQFKL